MGEEPREAGGSQGNRELSASGADCYNVGLGGDNLTFHRRAIAFRGAVVFHVPMSGLIVKRREIFVKTAQR